MKKFGLSLVLLTVVLSMSIYVTYAWFEIYNSTQVEISSGDFTVETEVYIKDILVTASNPYYNETTGLISLNAFDETVDNYINNVKVIIRITAHNTARFRVRIQDEWRLERTYTTEEQTIIVIPSEQRVDGEFVSRFNVNETFFRVNDDVFFYYDGLIDKGETVELTFLNGGTQYPIYIADTYTERAFINFSIYVDIVQANRIVEVWGVSENVFD